MVFIDCFICFLLFPILACQPLYPKGASIQQKKKYIYNNNNNIPFSPL
jgi:hypothetical protein